MIPANKLIARIRYKSKDFNATEYSDYDIMQAVNESLRYINQCYAVKSADFLEKRFDIVQATMNQEIAEYNETASEEDKLPLIDLAVTGAELPEDFMSVMQVTNGRQRLHYVPTYAAPKYGEYKISDGKVYANTDIVLWYRKKLLPVNSEQDSIDLPDIFFDPLAKIAGMVLANAENDILLKTVEDAVKAVVSGRKFSNMRRKMPFKV